MAKIAQLELLAEFSYIIFPGDTHRKLSEADFSDLRKTWKGIGKSLEKGNPIKFTPKVTNEAKRYINRYSKSVALQLMNLRKKIQENEIVPAKTEVKKLALNIYITQTERFINYFEDAEDEKTKAFIKLVIDTKNMILGEKENS